MVRLFSRHVRQWSAPMRAAFVVLGAIVACEIALVRRPHRSHGVALAVSGDSGAAVTDVGKSGKESLLPSAYAAALANALSQIDSLGAEVKRRGGVLPDFGRRAAVVVKKALIAAGSPIGRDAEAFEEVVDAPLYALFKQQLQVLRDRATDVYEELVIARPNPFEASETAQRFFLDGAMALVRPDSGWSFEAEQRDLLAWLAKSHSRDTQLVDVQGKQGQGKQVTIEVIKRLQKQADSIQREAEVRGAFPWNIKWQYFPERTPLGFRGQYAQGRSIVELLLMPDPRLKNNILNRIGPLNLAVGFDLFL